MQFIHLLSIFKWVRFFISFLVTHCLHKDRCNCLYIPKLGQCIPWWIFRIFSMICAPKSLQKLLLCWHRPLNIYYTNLAYSNLCDSLFEVPLSFIPYSFEEKIVLGLIISGKIYHIPHLEYYLLLN